MLLEHLEKLWFADKRGSIKCSHLLLAHRCTWVRPGLEKFGNKLEISSFNSIVEAAVEPHGVRRPPRQTEIVGGREV